MKKHLHFLYGLGLASLLGIGVSVSLSYADDECPDPGSPLRGAWSYSQVEQVNPSFGNLPVTAVGTLKVDYCGRFQGRGTDNIPCQDENCFGFGPLGVKNPLDVTFDGRIITQQNGAAAVTLTAFGTEFRRACVMMDKRGDCFQEFHCVATEPTPPNAVLLATFKRQGEVCR